MARFRQNPRSAGRVVEGTAFVVAPDDPAVLTLNDTATRVWELADGDGATLDEIAAALHKQFKVRLDSARADAERLCSVLVARGILEVTP